MGVVLPNCGILLLAHIQRPLGVLLHELVAKHRYHALDEVLNHKEDWNGELQPFQIRIRIEVPLAP
jgi:hypothetical protein